MDSKEQRPQQVGGKMHGGKTARPQMVMMASMLMVFVMVVLILMLQIVLPEFIVLMLVDGCGNAYDVMVAWWLAHSSCARID